MATTTDNTDSKPDKGDLPNAADSTTNQTGTAATATVEQVNCPRCSGRGKYDDGDPCEKCGGTGKVPSANKVPNDNDKSISNPDDVTITDQEDGDEDPDAAKDMTDDEETESGKPGKKKKPKKGDGDVNPDEADEDDTLNPDEVDPDEDPLKAARAICVRSGKGSAPKVGERIYKSTQLEVDTSSERTIKYVASDETADRYGDVIRAEGWTLENFVRNPVFLFAHDASQPPIGRVREIALKGKKLVASVEFMPEGMSTFCDSLWKMVRAGFLRAVSVGFYPTVPPEPILDKEGRFQGFEFIGQELVELSLVPVPANPNALQLAKSFGASERDLTMMFREYSDAKQREVSRHLSYRAREIDIAKARRHGS